MVLGDTDWAVVGKTDWAVMGDTDWAVVGDTGREIVDSGWMIMSGDRDREDETRSKERKC